MNYLQPERLDALARDFALGLMHGGARRRFERLLRSSRAAELAVLVWQERLAALAAPVPALQPSPALWQRLQAQVGPAAPRQSAAPSPWAWLGTLFSGRGIGRGIGRVVGGALAGMLLAVLVLRQQPALLDLEPARETLPPSYVGLLLDSAGKPTLLASSRRHGRSITIKMLQPLAVPAGQVAVLWALPKDGSAPFRVGSVPTQGSTTLPLTDSAEKIFFTVTRLAVSFEATATPAAPSMPGGAFVLSGHCVKLW